VSLPGTRTVAPMRHVMTIVAKRPWLITAALCGLVVLLGVHGPDSPAEDFRTWLFRVHGPLLYSDRWYAGHGVLGYSLLFPPVAALLGGRVVGVASCVVSTVLVTRLVRGKETEGYTLGLVWFAVAIVANLVVGRLPFALGLMFGIAAVLAVVRRRARIAIACAVLCSLASPLAGAFLLLFGVAWTRTAGLRRALPLAAALTGLAAAAIFGEGGVFPFPVVTLAAVLACVVLGLLFVPRAQRALRFGLLLYGASAVLLFALPNPVGGNISRLGSVLAGPVAALALVKAHRPRILALLTGPLLVWQLAPVTSAVADTANDPSARPEYYTGLLAFLDRRQVTRLEIPLTRNHWETALVAPSVPLARGWERQLDVEYNGLFYRSDLTAADYHRWLTDNAVSMIALPDVPLDPSSMAEASLLKAGAPWLRVVWHDQHWQVWQVVDAPPVVSGPATLADLGVSSFDVRFTTAGTALVRVHYSRFFRVVFGTGCVGSSAEGWTTVTAFAPGTVTVAARLGSSGQQSADSPVCPS
jgi:hypothetical protein